MDGRPRRKESVLTRSSPDALVLLDVDSGEYFSLDPVGARIWQFCSGELTPGDIAEAVAREYDAPHEAVVGDVLELLTDLRAARLLVD